MKPPFKMWANDNKEARSILNAMYAHGYSWGHCSEPPEAIEKGGFYVGSWGDETCITYSNRDDREYYEQHSSPEFHFATPVELSNEFVEISELDGQIPVVDMVNNPSHYTSHKSGVECIEITRHMGFNLGNAMKYIWRCDLKKDAIEDLKKAVFYLNDEISLREKQKDIQ